MKKMPAFINSSIYRIHFLEAFRLTLIGRKRWNEQKQLSVWMIQMLNCFPSF